MCRNCQHNAFKQNFLFAGYLAYGIGTWIALQTLINVGVNTGMLPTKGLTLPFMSYGGSSMLAMCAAIALLLRVDYETHSMRKGSSSRQAASRKTTRKLSTMFAGRRQ